MKILLFVLLFVSASIYSQTYSIEFSKQEILNELHSINDSLIYLNETLQMIDYNQKAGYGYINTEILNVLNDDIINNYNFVSFITLLLQSAHIQDAEIDSALSYTASLINSIAYSYLSVEQSYLQTIQKIDPTPEMLMRLAGMFLPHSLMSLLTFFTAK